VPISIAATASAFPATATASTTSVAAAASATSVAVAASATAIAVATRYSPLAASATSVAVAASAASVAVATSATSVTVATYHSHLTAATTPTVADVVWAADHHDECPRPQPAAVVRDRPRSTQRPRPVRDFLRALPIRWPGGGGSLSSLPSIAIADGEQQAAFLNRCKDTCLGSADCVGFVEAGCDQAGCTLCEFRSAAASVSYVVPAPQTYLWLGGTSRASKTGAANAASLDTYPYDDGAATPWPDAAASSSEEGKPCEDAGQLAFSPTEFAAVIGATLLSGALIGATLALACSRCRARLAARGSAHKAKPSVPLPPHYFEGGIAVKPEASSELSSERSFGSVSANV